MVTEDLQVIMNNKTMGTYCQHTRRETKPKLLITVKYSFQNMSRELGKETNKIILTPVKG